MINANKNSPLSSFSPSPLVSTSELSPDRLTKDISTKGSTFIVRGLPLFVNSSVVFFILVFIFCHAFLNWVALRRATPCCELNTLSIVLHASVFFFTVSASFLLHSITCLFAVIIWVRIAFSSSVKLGDVLYRIFAILTRSLASYPLRQNKTSLHLQTKRNR